MGWKDNPGMEWFDPRPANKTATPNQWVKISDHGRSAINVSNERLETKQRMANSYLRRYAVAKKRTWTTSWENLPDKNVAFLANGQSGEWMEKFHTDVDGSFLMRLRSGSDVDQALSSTKDNVKVVEVMIADFSKAVVKRGAAFDLWSVDISLEEV